MRITTTIALLALTAGAGLAAPIRTLPGLVQVTFYEGSGGPATPITFAANSAALTNQVAGIPGPGNNDFTGLPNEYYDVYYSDATGVFSLNGEYISVAAHYDSNSSSGLNIAAVQLDFGGPVQYATSVSSFLPGPNGYVAGSELNAIGSNLSTFTAMGRNSELDSMRITLGFDQGSQSQVPEPSTWALGALGLAVCAALKRNRI